MQFLFPGVLWGLLALAIPIIIHLFHFRRYKQVYFTNVKYLKELKDERSANRKLRNLLVLLSRCLAIALLVLAFAQPFFGGDNKTLDQKLVSVFVDNSFSMTSLNNDVPLIDKAKKRAEQIVDSYAETDRFQVLTHNYSGVSSKILSKEDALDEIETIETSSRTKSLSTILQKQIETYLDQEGDRSFFLISDFQESITDLAPTTDTSYALNLIPIASLQESNISIDSVYFTSPATLINQNNALVVKLTNHSDEEQEDIILSVFQDGQKKPAGSIDIAANSSILDTVTITFLEEGQKNIKLQIQDYPIQFDDTYYLTTNIAPNTKVLSIYDNRSNKYVKALFAGISEVDLQQTSASSLNYSSFEDYQLIILEDLSTITSGLVSELNQYVIDGGNVLCFPGKNGSVSSYNQFFNQLNAPNMVQWVDGQQEIFGINTDEYVFNKVYLKKSNNADLPTITGQYKFETNSRNQGETLLSYRNGKPYISKYKRGSGHLYVSKAPIDRQYNKLVEYAEVFVPMIYKMTYAKGQDQPLAFNIGQTSQFTLANGSSTSETIFSILGDEGEYIPQQQNLGAKTEVKITDEVKQAGFFEVRNEKNTVMNLAFNYNRKESNPKVIGPETLEQFVGEKGSVYIEENTTEFLSKLKEKEEGVFLWKWCLIFALLFLAFETIILRFWK